MDTEGYKVKVKPIQVLGLPFDSKAREYCHILDPCTMVQLHIHEKLTTCEGCYFSYAGDCQKPLELNKCRGNDVYDKVDLTFYFHRLKSKLLDKGIHIYETSMELTERSFTCKNFLISDEILGIIKEPLTIGYALSLYVFGDEITIKYTFK